MYKNNIAPCFSRSGCSRGKPTRNISNFWSFIFKSNVADVKFILKRQYYFPTQLLKARINNSDHRKKSVAMKLDKVPGNELNFLRCLNEINQKILVA